MDPEQPKTDASVRSITISPFTASVLGDQLGQFALSGIEGLVSPNRAGHPLISSSVWNSVMSPAMAKAGVRCRFHDLRHTSVALASAEGAHPKAFSPGWATHRSLSAWTGTVISSPSLTGLWLNRSVRA